VERDLFRLPTFNKTFNIRSSIHIYTNFVPLIVVSVVPNLAVRYFERIDFYHWDRLDVLGSQKTQI